MAAGGEAHGAAEGDGRACMAVVGGEAHGAAGVAEGFAWRRVARLTGPRGWPEGLHGGQRGLQDCGGSSGRVGIAEGGGKALRTAEGGSFLWSDASYGPKNTGKYLHTKEVLKISFSLCELP